MIYQEKEFNQLYFGDNLEVLKKIPEKRIDLIYMDPPFATGLDFYISECRSNSISYASHAKLAYSDKFSLKSYLDYMRPRLQLLYNLLSPRGSLYLHIDSSRVHYIKVMLDEIFDIKNFRADITRIKCNPKNFKRKNYGNIKDHILFYSKSENYIWNNLEANVKEEDLLKRYNKKDSQGRFYTTVPLHAPGETKNGDTGGAFLGQLPPEGRHWRYSPQKLNDLYNQGLIEVSKTGNMRLKLFREDNLTKKIQDIWDFKDPQKPSYPTEKNEKLLEQILLNSSREDSIVLDPFCGSGVTLMVAEKFSRRWIGIDQSEESIQLIQKKLKGKSPYQFYPSLEESLCLNF